MEKDHLDPLFRGYVWLLDRAGIVWFWGLMIASGFWIGVLLAEVF